MGKDCPICGKRTRREPSPLLLKPLRWILRKRFTYRRCEECGWRGGAFHAPADERSRSRRTPGPSPGGPRRTRGGEAPGA
ncbi:MAG: hypothetical protein JWM27_701 [Gemmatimonadetes bacterium]|nr:hypothetical protein [Gemmatimonadota bacterium]